MKKVPCRPRASEPIQRPSLTSFCRSGGDGCPAFHTASRLIARASMREGRHFSLLCRVRDVLCTLPLEHVEETMRPLAVEAIAGVPSFVQGLAVVRGVPIPVVDVARLFSGDSSHPARFVTVKTGTRHIALAVDAVLGVVEIPPASVETLPPLFQTAGLDAIAAIGVLDAELLLVLRNTRLVPDDVWTTIQDGGTKA